jgi:hypothetical protein
MRIAWPLQISRAIAPALNAQDRETFLYGGYFARDAGGGLVVIALNTLVYSRKHVPDTSDEEDPLGQFAWLHRTLAAVRAESKRAYISGHIAPGMDSWQRHRMWAEHYVTRYLEITGRFTDVVMGHLYGHLHSDQFRALPGQPAPLLLTGAISTIFGGNPSFRVMVADPDTWQIMVCDGCVDGCAQHV